VTATTTARPRSTLRSPEEEARYHLGFARMLAARGYSMLARSHELLAGAHLPEAERRENVSRSWVAWREARGMDREEEG
jgi:hypothetical protein